MHVIVSNLLLSHIYHLISSHVCFFMAQFSSMLCMYLMVFCMMLISVILVLTQSGAVGALLSALHHLNAPATHVYVCLALDKLVSASNSSLNTTLSSPNKRNRSLTSDPHSNNKSYTTSHHQHHQSTPFHKQLSLDTKSISSPAACSSPLVVSLHDTTSFLIQSGCLSRMEQLSKQAFTLINHADERSCHTSHIIEQAQLLDSMGVLLSQMIRGGIFIIHLYIHVTPRHEQMDT